ncbi:MAG: hypothetical protein SFV20_09065 [Sphingopyxis sp.]|nr:hypothetical protein [Sphingopyxis sp.]
MGKRLILAAAGTTLIGALSVPIAVASPAMDNGCQAANPAPPKAKERKPAETREKKRSGSGRSCLGCIVPLDGLSSTMAIATDF